MVGVTTMGEQMTRDEALAVIASVRVRLQDQPDDCWCTHELRMGDKCCALGHLVESAWATKLAAVVETTGTSYSIVGANNGRYGMFRQSTPKARSLAYLDYLEELVNSLAVVG